MLSGAVGGTGPGRVGVGGCWWWRARGWRGCTEGLYGATSQPAKYKGVRQGWCEALKRGKTAGLRGGGGAETISLSKLGYRAKF